MSALVDGGLSELNAEERRVLLTLARRGVAHAAAHDDHLVVAVTTLSASLQEPRGCFVTLEREGALRGCVGCLVPRASLAEEVLRAAHGAACRDPRFSRVVPSEVAELTLKLSVLSSPRRLSFASEDDLLAQLRPGLHGVTLRDGARVGTFLPAVWQRISEPRAFLRELKRKAGLSPDAPATTLEVEIYTAQGFGDA